MPKVSVIMPCYNHVRFVSEAIKSVLGQTFGELELIVTDDCSSDGSFQAISELARQDPRVKMVRHEKNQGLSRSRNDALSLATGDYIAFCDSDDVWEPDKLSTQVKLLEQKREYDVAYSDTSVIDENGEPTGKLFSDLYPKPKVVSGWLLSELAQRNFINIQSVLLRRICLKNLPLFDERIEWIQDWWCWIRLSREHQFVFSDAPLARYRVHSSSSNVVHGRAYCVNRFKVFRRLLKESSSLTRAARANILLTMGADLCSIGKTKPGRRLVMAALGMSRLDFESPVRGLRAVRRLFISIRGVGTRFPFKTRPAPRPVLAQNLSITPELKVL